MTSHYNYQHFKKKKKQFEVLNMRTLDNIY
jgi:hypothetical protein